MRRPTSILAILDRSRMDHDVLAKAARTAERSQSRLELFLCDAEHAYALKHEYEPSRNPEVRQECLAKAVAYLSDRRGSLGLPAERVSVSAACESPLYEGIVRRVAHVRPDLVIKGAGNSDGPRPRFDPNDWQLMRRCEATLMMTRGRVWRGQPRFAAAVDISRDETQGLAASVVETAEMLRSLHGGDLDVLHAAPDIDAVAKRARELTLERVTRETQGIWRLLDGEAEQILPRYTAERDYDVLVIGALTHRPGMVDLVGSLTSRLMEAVDCDFVLVKPEPAGEGANTV
ncbi:MAG TPA: hypothetical protein VHB68_05775 [Steroidobacteraceae bacterium]|nr:hypothetical protein [Steroidobacteraceae bacterium]